jgi:hypothetical protein
MNSKRFSYFSMSLLTFLEFALDRMLGKPDGIQHLMKLLISREPDCVLVLAFGIFILHQAGFWGRKMRRRLWGLQLSLAATDI